MRNLKKFLALVLATMMLLSVAVISTSAADAADYTDAANHLAALQVMKGNENGDLMLANGVTRYQAALFFVQALTGETDVAVWNADKKSTVFTDVPEYGTAIDHANGIGIVKGRGNGIFGYNDAITYQDMLVMAVRALGYETEGMSYPYGYILAAQKLGLTENVDQVNYKAALTRGETAQIIWDMLGTEIAVVDPLTDKVLYPGETGLTDAITDTVAERVTLLEDSGLAGGKIETAIVDFIEADKNDEEDFDKVELANGLILAAADLDITAETRKVTYMGLPVEIFVSVDEDDFTQGDYDDGDAEVVFATKPAYTAVLNLGEEAAIKYVDGDNAYYSFGGAKFADNKYEVKVREFGVEGWKESTKNLAATFAYDTKDGYTGEADTYASISYRVVSEPTKEDGVTVEGVVEVLYTPLSFGQYNVREINDTKYTVIGTYEEAAVENLDEEMSNFVEYLVDGAAKVTVNTKSISNKKGEAAATVTVEGAAVEAGDFMFYAYNETDNVLTVAANAGKFNTGRLTAQTAKNETVKISGTNFEVGFKGNFATDWASEFNAETNKTFIQALEAGKDNVKYLVVEGNIVYMEACSETPSDSKFDFAIVTTDHKIMADLLSMSQTKYENALFNGLYVDNDVVKVAMMNKTTGEWELASISTYVEGWVVEDEEFTNEYDVATEIKYTDLITDYKNADVVSDFATLVEAGLVAVIDEVDDVYTVAANEADFFVYGDTTDGLLFSDNSPKTNAITADNEVDAARVTLDDESVIIVISTSGVGSRVGIQTAENSVAVAGKFLAASNNLIVLATDELFDVTNWADAKTINSGENWFITTVDTGVEIEASENEEETYIITITNLYDMKAMEIIKSIKYEANTFEALEFEGAGNILFKSATGEIIVAEDEFSDIILKVANDNEDKLEYVYTTDIFDWIDVDTVNVDTISKTEAVDVNATVVTLDMIGLESDEYNFAGAVSTKLWNDEIDTDNNFGVSDTTITYGEDEKTVWEYQLDAELVNEINEPTDGIYNTYIATNTDAIYIPVVDNDDYANAITVNIKLYVVYSYENGVIDTVIYKVINN